MVAVSAVQADITVGTSGPWLGRLFVEQEMIEIRSARQSRPDMKWVFVDNAGHWHAFDADGKTPTLREYAEHVECDGSCGGVCQGEGYHVTRWKCLGCGVSVKPRFNTEYDVRSTVPGMTSWSVQLLADGTVALPQYPDKVSVRATTGAGTYFGLAVLGDMTWSGGGDRITVDVQLVGASPLGRRP